MLDVIKKLMKVIIGDPWDSRGYKQMMKRVKALPKDYQYVFRKIKHYMTVHGVGPDGDLAIFTDLVDLFEASAAEGRQVLEVIGSDVGEFCNELIQSHSSTSPIYAEFAKNFLGDINKDIAEKFKKEGK